MHKGSSPTFADIDGDGDLDLVIGSAIGDKVYILRRDGSQYFDMSVQSGVTISATNTISISFADYDNDDDLDMFTAHWGNSFDIDSESLWQNNGDGTYNNASIQSGIASQLLQNRGTQTMKDFSFTPIFSDIDKDGDQDLLITADLQSSQVFRNNNDSSFTLITDREVITDQNGMGASVGDYDNDGDMDWFVTSIYEEGEETHTGNRLYQNQGDGTFIDVTSEAGISDGGWGWGSCMDDFDNDGDIDIVHVNGFDAEFAVRFGFVHQQIRYFENQGDKTFIETASAAGLLDTGQGRGLICFDSDRDGDLDIMVGNNDVGQTSDVLYENLLNTNHFLTIKLQDSGLNSQGIGAWIEVTGDSTQVREIRKGNNYVSSNPAEAHFGLISTSPVSILVHWPDGTDSVLNNVAVDQLITI